MITSKNYVKKLITMYVRAPRVEMLWRASNNLQFAVHRASLPTARGVAANDDVLRTWAPTHGDGLDYRLRTVAMEAPFE